MTGKGTRPKNAFLQSHISVVESLPTDHSAPSLSNWRFDSRMM